MIRKIMSYEAQKMGTEIPQSDYKNLIRKISNRFEELQFVQKSPNNVLVYRSTIKIEDLVSENYDLQSELNTFNNLKSDNETAVINAAKMLHNEIKTHPPAMSWPPKEHELDPSKLSKDVPDLLDRFCSVLITGTSSDNGSNISERTLRLKNSIAQDFVYSVSNGNIKTPKSVLFPTVVKIVVQ